tara:strand:+ start:13029 stop:14123 length:1095 start_codon:yes stop_codon:yes gene_type:complete
LKVIAVINNLDTGGAERLLVKTVPKLVEYGITVDVLLLNGKEYPFLTELRKRNCCTIYSLDTHNVRNPFHIFKIIPHLFKYDIVHVHLFPALYWVALAKLFSFSRTTLVFTEHSTTNNRRGILFYRWLDKLIYGQYAVIVTISTEVKLYLKRYLGKTRNIFRTINNGVDVSRFQQAKKSERQDFNIPSNHTLIIQVASFTSQKDPATLVRAIPYLEHPATLIFVGKGAEMEKIKQLVSELDLDRSVQFLGMRTDVASLLKMADVAVLSSNHEGLSLSSLEAMASGTPLVAANVTGLKNLVHGAGILFDHKDEIDLAEKINMLVSNKKLYTETVAKGTKRVKKFELEVMVQSHIALYKELCPNKK